MIPEIGQFALVLALTLALIQATLPLIGAARGIPSFVAVAKPAAQAPARGAAPARAVSYKPEAPTLLQVMRGILFPNSNIIFLAQDLDPTKFPPTAADQKFGNPYPGWQSVENASLALAEAANLLMIPGRKCSNGQCSMRSRQRATCRRSAHRFPGSS